MTERDTEFEAFNAHFPKIISAEIADYATNAVLTWSRYLFTRRVKGIQFGFCTHCKKEHVTIGNLKHNDFAECKKCGSTCEVKASGLGRKKLFDEAYLLYYMKSEINPNAIIAQGYYLTRDYREDYHKTETQLKVVSMYLFEPGYSKMYRREYWTKTENRFFERKNICSEAVNSMQYKRCYHATHSIKEAVLGTPFQYCTWEKYKHQDYVMVFDLATKYPCIEFLTKIGLEKVVEAKLGAGPTYGVINWHGKTPEKVLRMTKQEIKQMRSSGVPITTETLKFYHQFKRQGLNYTMAEAHAMKGLENGFHRRELEAMTVLCSEDRIKRYLLKQFGKEEVRTSYPTGPELLVAWRDYTRECKKLGIDLTKEYRLFPNNLKEAHTRTSNRIKMAHDRVITEKINNRLPQLDKFQFEYKGFILRPARTPAELFEEGKVQNICIGGYTEDYADGITSLFFIRKTDEPDKPFYALEVRGQKVVQCQGFDHCMMTSEVEEFVYRFIEKKLITKKRSRIDVTGIRQEVAI